ncbi:hypothetical protein JXD38_00825, partial [candidate division WOR-3 bacterium]|nr:hypothetical protein [candidate division WOR-3 bacterium]
TDSVVAVLPEVGSAVAVCWNPTAQKVYAATVDTLFAIRTDGDSVVARAPFDSLKPLLACDPQRNRIYCTGSRNDWGYWSSVDCTADTILKTTVTILPITFLACNATRDMLYVFLRSWFDEVLMYDGTTGQELTSVTVHGVPRRGGWSPGLDRLYCVALDDGSGYSTCLLSAVDGTRDSIGGVVPLTVKAENIALDTVHNRLYFTYSSTGCGCVGVVDCAQNVVTSYSYAGRYPAAPCYNPNNNRLYWVTWDAVVVYDCSTNAVTRRVANTSGYVYTTRLHAASNKLYACADTPGGKVIDVIDCGRDSVIKVVSIPDYGGSFQELLLVPEDNTVWYLGLRSVVAIDCLGDSIVASAPDTLGTISDACACPEDRRIYTGEEGFTARSVNMDKPAEVDTLHERIPASGKMHFVNIPDAHKTYWSYAYPSHWPGSSCIFVIDTRTNALVDSFWVGQMISDMCLDHTGNFVYCASMADSALLVLDARGDSAFATVRLPPTMAAEKNSLALNRATNRIYIAQYDYYRYGDEIPVIRDSMLIGVEELAPPIPSRFAGATVVRRGIPMRVSETGELWDAAGRKAATLKAGLNDMSRLAPGVYFVRQGLGTRGEGLGRTRKVVVTR